MNNTPDFLIIGTMKSGTSSLAFYLNQHPEIGMPEREVHFFNRNRQKGTDWYINFLNSYRKTEETLVGEKTPWYCWEEGIAKEIYELNPDVKLIWLFREPIQRLISHYNHNLSTGLEINNLPKAIKKEPQRIEKNLQYGYVFGSEYIKQVNTYLKYFPIENMLFVSFEDFIKSPLNITNQTISFLNRNPLKNINSEIRNKTKIPKFPFLLYWTRKFFGRDSRPFSLAYRINYFMLDSSKRKIRLSAKTESALKERFSTQMKELSQLTGKNFFEIWYNN